MRVCGCAVAASHDAERCAQHCGASARSHAEQHHPLAPPPAERLEQEVQPHRHPQRLRVCAFAAEYLPIRRAARDAQIDDEHAEAPLAELPTRRQQRQPAAQQQHRPHWLQEAFAAASASD